MFAGGEVVNLWVWEHLNFSHALELQLLFWGKRRNGVTFYWENCVQGSKIGFVYYLGVVGCGGVWGWGSSNHSSFADVGVTPLSSDYPFEVLGEHNMTHNNIEMSGFFLCLVFGSKCRL